MWWLGLALLWATPGDQLELTSWTTTEGLPQSSVNAIDQAPDGVLIIGTYAGLVRFDGRDFRLVDPQADAGWSGLRITAVHVVDGGDVLVGTQDGRLLRVSSGGFESLPVPAPMRGQPVWSLSSHGQTLWVAGPVGVAKFDGTQWSTVAGLKSASSVFADDAGCWVGADAGVMRIEAGRAELVTADVGGRARVLSHRGSSVRGRR